MDRLDELKAFFAVVDAGGFSAAARRTGASQPSLSKAVGALEMRLGVRLLNRTTRSVIPTDLSRSYYERTRPLVEELDEADGRLASSTSELCGLVRIAAPSTIGRLHVLPLIPRFLECNPGLQLDLILADTVRDMVEDRIDLAIRGGPVDAPDAIVRRLAGTPLVCAGSRRYFGRRGIPKHPAELAGHNCLIYGAAGSAEWAFAGPKGRFSVPVSGNLSSNSIETIRAAVLAGVGVGLLARLSLGDCSKARRSSPFWTTSSARSST